MKNHSLRSIGACAALAFLLGLPALSQTGGTETITAHVVPGGGGQSANAALELSGSAGQPSTATSANGNLSLTGGFWAGGVSIPTGTGVDLPDMPVATRLAAPYPNPFNPSTRIAFELAAPASVRLRIYDTRGLMVRDLVADDYPAGRHEIAWDGRDVQGGRAPSGVYFVRFEAAGVASTAKMTLLK